MRTVDLPLTSEQRHFMHYVLKDDDATDVGYGGARGGNKTACGCIAMILRRISIPGSRGIGFRRTEKASIENLRDETGKWARKMGVELVWKAVEKKFVFPNRSEFHLASVWNYDSYQKFIGLQFTDMYWEEAVQHERENVALVNGSCRTDIAGCIPKKWYTTNPGGPGHQFLYDDFVNPRTRKEGHRWVRSTLHNALPTLVNDPGYMTRLTRGLSAWKKAQWIEGDWLAMAGQYFDIHPSRLCEFDTPNSPLDGIKKDRVYWADPLEGVDYGAQAPFCVLFALKWQDQWGVDHIHFVSEIYKRNLHMDEQAREALDARKVLEREYRIEKEWTSYGDPSIGYPKPSESVDQDFTIKQVWGKNGWHVIPSHKIGRTAGWMLMRMLLKDGVMTISPSGCPAFIAELRNAVYEKPDSHKSEDISQACADHALTAASYLLRKVFLGGYVANREDVYSPVKVVRPAVAGQYAEEVYG